MGIVIAEMACALIVGSGLGILGAIMLDWKREREELAEENKNLRERLRKVGAPEGFQLLNMD